MKCISFLVNLIIVLLILTIISNKENTDEIKEDDKIRDRAAEYKKRFSLINPIQLTDQNYSDFLNANPYTLIYFHSCFSESSINFLPTFEVINNYINNYDNYSIINVVSIELSDDENNTKLQSRYRFSVLPCFIFYSAIIGKFVEYSSYMTPQSIVSFVTKGSRDSIITMNDQKLFNQLINPKYTYLVVFAIKDNNYSIDDFFKISNKYQYILFANCIDFEICKKYFNESIYNNDIVLAKMYNCDNDYVCSQNKTVKNPILIPYNYSNFEKFENFVSLNAIPKIHYLTYFSYELMKLNNFATIIYIKGKLEKKSSKEISLILYKLIQKNENIIWGSILDPFNSPIEYELSKLLGIEPEDFREKGLVIIHTSNPNKNDYGIYRINQKYINSFDEINEIEIQKFINEFSLNIIKKDIKSENKPKNHPKKNLRMVVGKTFKEEILENSKQSIVLILITLNTKKLHFYEDQIESLTIKFDKFKENLIFAFLDPASNEMPNSPIYDITQKPFYRYYYKDKSKGFVDYLDDCDNESKIEKWIIKLYFKDYQLKMDEKEEMYSYISYMSDLLKDEKTFKEIQKEQKKQRFEEKLGIKTNSTGDKSNKTRINNTNKNKKYNKETKNTDL